MNDLTIFNPPGERLDHRFAPGAAERRVDGWIVILAHGVTGDLDRPLMVDTAAALNAAGFDTLRISFAGNGGSEGDFREATISKETADLGAVIDAVAADYSRIAVIGHSMGAAVAVMRAAGDPRVAALVSLAGMVDTKLFAETEFGMVVPGEGLMWDEPGCPLSLAYMDDLCGTIVSTVPQAGMIAIPWLLVHGTADDVVLPADTELIAAMGKANVTAMFIEGADHSFNDPAHKAQVTEAVCGWLAGVAAKG